MRCVSVLSFGNVSVPFVFCRFFKRDVDGFPDVSRGEQIVCDKQIVGAEELFVNRELRVFGSLT